MRKRKKPLIGVFTAELSDGYQAAIWNGIADQADSLGFDVICFLGSRLESPLAPEHTANNVYELAKGHQVDGLVIITSAITSHLNTEEVLAFLDNFSSVPLVSIGYEHSGVSSLTVNSDSGLISVLEHLITVHRLETMALISGPRGHEESDTRTKVFLQVLDDHNLQFDTRLYYEGTFEDESGRNGIRHIIESGVPFDTVVCLNDKMALGVLEEVDRLNLSVPEDFALVGFDGIDEAFYSYPRLTTVIQPLEDLGRSAVNQLQNLFEGNKPEQNRLPCIPVIAESCGCSQFVSGGITARGNPEIDLSGNILYQSLQSAVSSLSEDQFFALLKSELSGNRKESPKKINNLRMMLFSLQRGLLSPDQESSGNQEKPLALLTRGLTYLADTYSSSIAARRYADLERYSNSRYVAASLSEAFELEAVLVKLAEGLHSLGFRNAILMVNGSYSGLQVYRLESAAGDFRFSESGIVLDGVLFLGSSSDSGGSSQWILIPLAYQSENLGYLILPARIVDPALYDVLGKQLSGSIKSSQLLEQVMSHEQSLEQEVARRTEDLVETNRILQQEVETRKRLEQEVTTISNETMNRIGQDLHDDLCQHLAGISMLVTAFGNSFPGESEMNNTLETISSLLNDSIDRAKGIARGLLPLGLHEYGLVKAVEILIDATVRKGGPEITLQAEDELSFTDSDQELQIYRIIQEALSNAVHHSEGNRISIRFSSVETGSGHRQYFAISDTGTIRWTPAPGSGMGLKIMKYRAEKAGINLSIQNTETGTTVSGEYSLHGDGQHGK